MLTDEIIVAHRASAVLELAHHLVATRLLLAAEHLHDVLGGILRALVLDNADVPVELQFLDLLAHTVQHPRLRLLRLRPADKSELLRCRLGFGCSEFRIHSRHRKRIVVLESSRLLIASRALRHLRVLALAIIEREEQVRLISVRFGRTLCLGWLLGVALGNRRLLGHLIPVATGLDGMLNRRLVEALRRLTLPRQCV